MPIGALIGAGAGLLGSMMGADAAGDAAQASANAQLQAARIAAEEARFRPVGITSRFGTSRFQFDDKGRLSGAGYDVAPDIATIRDRLLSQAGGQGIGATEQALAAQQGLFNLGQQYLATSPEEAAQSWMQRQQAALAPAREQAYNKVQQSLFNKGRSGLAIGQGAGMQAANPEMAAYYNALAQQDLNLAAQAQEQGRAATQFGAGLFGLGAQAAQAGYSPLQTQLGLGQTIEQLGQGALDIGSTLGGRAMSGGAQAGQSLLAGGLGAARTMQGANQYSPTGALLSGLVGNQQFTSGLGNWFASLGQTSNPMGLGSINPVTGEYMGSLEF